MIQKKVLIELIRNRLISEYQAKELGKLGDRRIAYYVGRAYNAALANVLARRLSDYSDYTKEYQSVAISKDSNTDVYYSTLPANIIIVPKRAGSGIIRISGMKSESVEFVPMTNNELQTIEGLEVDTIDDVVGYVFKNGRVEYKGMTSTIAAGTVKMELIIPFEAYSDTDILQLPLGSDEMILQSVVNMLIGMPDSDKMNDGNSLNKNLIRRNDGR